MLPLGKRKTKMKAESKIEHWKKKRVHLSWWCHYQEITGQSHLVPAPHPSLTSNLWDKSTRERYRKATTTPAKCQLSSLPGVPCPSRSSLLSCARWDKPPLPQAGPTAVWCTACILKHIWNADKFSSCWLYLCDQCKNDGVFFCPMCTLPFHISFSTHDVSQLRQLIVFSSLQTPQTRG